jgi:catechol 2,3-dioxygenase-like lactoylglutathione lyase family enzyme
MATIRSAAPQLLVSDLAKSLAFYGERLGFGTDFVYEGFYAAVSRDGATLHLKCAPRLEGERAHRRAGDHLDAYLDVSGVRELHEELGRRGAPIARALTSQPWGRLEFHVEDPDGHILCFSEDG